MCIAQGNNPNVAEYFISPSDKNRSLLALISRRPAATCQELAQQAAAKNATGIATELTCYRRLVAGTGSLQLTTQRLRALPFR